MVAYIQAHLTGTYFAWSGPTTAGGTSYFRVTGPPEFAGQGSAGGPGGTPGTGSVGTPSTIPGDTGGTPGTTEASQLVKLPTAITPSVALTTRISATASPASPDPTKHVADGGSTSLSAQPQSDCPLDCHFHPTRSGAVALWVGFARFGRQPTTWLIFTGRRSEDKPGLQ